MKKNIKMIMDEFKIPGFITDMHKQINEKFVNDFNERLKEYLISKLYKIGINVKNDEEFIELIKTRITRIAFDDKPDYYEFYLDFVDHKNRGIKIGAYSTKIEMITEGNRVTAIWEPFES